MKKVYYVGYFDTPDSNQNREYFVSATNFMSYVADTIRLGGFEVEIVSMSDSKAMHLEKGQYRKRIDNVYLKTFFSWGKKRRWVGRVDIHLLRLQMFFYLLFNVRREDIVIVYHSLNYVRILTLLKKVKRCKIVSQLCEVYGDVGENLPEKLLRHEFDLVNNSDAYMFSNRYLEQTYNKNHLPNIVVHGIYRSETKGKDSAFDDGKIHVVYAGTLDPRKGGAAAAFLDDRYHIHILGFGSGEQIMQLKKQISNAQMKGKATVTYDGLLQGEEFTKFLSKCQIGLATQIPDASFCKSSFPSKTLTYLASGLEVVSSRYEAIEQSDIGSYLHYYDHQRPEEIAACIMGVKNFKKRENILDELNSKFRRELWYMLNSI